MAEYSHFLRKARCASRHHEAQEMANLQAFNANRLAAPSLPAGMRAPNPVDVASSNNTSQFFLRRQQPSWMTRAPGTHETRDANSAQDGETFDTRMYTPQPRPGRPPKRKIHYDTPTFSDLGPVPTRSAQRRSSDAVTDVTQEMDSIPLTTLDPSVRRTSSTELPPNAATMSDTIVVRRREPLQLPPSPSTSPDAESLRRTTIESSVALEHASLQAIQLQKEGYPRHGTYAEHGAITSGPTRTASSTEKDADYLGELEIVTSQLRSAEKLSSSEAQVLGVLQDACNMKDRFFLRLHQFACREVSGFLRNLFCCL